ncbi:Sorting nexin-29 [Dissostichus eleginoides]|uniref:Sorting nexin-29 n=1 Tax=Dissostichus eleginoides TaxID=100907 RepID=A0AAD9F0D9_DISEL|nr:Sorting nexin-29 [Dissostichus eleginoides]
MRGAVFTGKLRAAIRLHPEKEGKANQQCTLVPCLPLVSNAHPAIHQTRPSSSIALWSSSDAYVPIGGSFSGGQGPRMNCFSNLSYSCSSVGPDHTGQPSLPLPLNEPPLPMTLSQVHQFSFLRPLLVGTDHCRPGTPHKSCSFGDALTQSFSHHNLALVKVAHILTLTHFCCFQHINFETKCSLAA